MDYYSKGFITVAAGKYYCKLAKHLYISYKMFGNCSFPFYVITDEDGEAELAGNFDGIIVKKDIQYNWLDKLLMFTDSPFTQTVFLDADSSVVCDISCVFELFESNNSDISAIGYIKELKTNEQGVQFGDAAVKKYNLKYDFPKFNGGVYYYRKTELSNSYIDLIYKEIIPQYYFLNLLSGQLNEKYDEPVIILAMLILGMRPISPEENVMFLVENGEKVMWNMTQKKCKYLWNDRVVSPRIIHWKVGGTETFNYEKYDAKLNGLYYSQNFFWVKWKQILSFIKHYIYPTLLRFFPQVRKIAKKFCR